MATRNQQALLSTVLSLIVLIVVGALGTATAEPHKNQIVVEDASCSNGQKYTFVINGMAKTGLLTDSSGNFVVTSYTINYYDDQGNLLDTDKYDTGSKLNSQDDILSCSGQVETTLQGLGDVRAVYEFKGFLTPPAG
jgi:hypothetical protein